LTCERKIPLAASTNIASTVVSDGFTLQQQPSIASDLYTSAQRRKPAVFYCEYTLHAFAVFVISYFSYYNKYVSPDFP